MTTQLVAICKSTEDYKPDQVSCPAQHINGAAVSHDVHKKCTVFNANAIPATPFLFVVTLHGKSILPPMPHGWNGAFSPTRLNSYRSSVFEALSLVLIQRVCTVTLLK